MGAIPAISKDLGEKQGEMMKEWVQTMFIGGLYSTKQESAMAVVVPLSQAKDGRV